MVKGAQTSTQVAQGARAGSLARRFFGFFFSIRFGGGFDFFISYARRDARDYAQGLREQLTKAGLRCFFDEADFQAGSNLSEATKSSLRNSSALILVGSPGVVLSPFVPQELEIFGEFGGPVIPINIEHALEGELPLAISKAKEGRLWIDEPLESLVSGPSAATIGKLLQGVDFTRQERRRMQAFAVATLVFAAVACAAVVFGLAAKRESRISRSRELAAESQRLLAVEPQRLGESLSLALEGAETWATPETLSAVRQVLRLTPRGRTVLKTKGAPSVMTAAVTVVQGQRVFALSARTGDSFEVRILKENGEPAPAPLPMSTWPEALAFDPDGKLLAIGLRGEGGVQIREWRTGQLKAHLAHPKVVHGLAWRGGGGAQIASACGDGKVRLWDIAAPQQAVDEWTLDEGDPELAAPVFRVAFNAEGTRIAAAGGRDRKGRVRLRELGTGQDILSGKDVFARDLDGAVTGLALTPDARVLAAGTLHGRLEVWRTQENDTLISRTAANDAPIDSVAMRDDGRFVSCAGWEKAACVWDLSTTQEAMRAPHTGKVSALAFLPGAGPLLTASFDGAMALWEVDSGGWERRWEMEKNSLSWVHFSRSEDEWWCGSLHVGVQHGSLEGKTMERVPGIQHPPTGFALAPDDRTAVIGTGDGVVRLLDTIKGTSRDLPRGATDPHGDRAVRSVGFSSNGARVAAASADGWCDAWDVKSGQSLFRSPQGQGYSAVSFSHDGGDMLYGGKDKELHWGRLDGTGTVGTLPCPAEIGRIAASPCAAEAAVIAGQEVLLVERECGKWVEKHRVTMPAAASVVAWSPNGKFLLVGDGEGRAVLCNRSRQPGEAKALHTAGITSAVFSRDGKLLATGSEDGTAALWQTPDMTLLGRFEHPGTRSPLARVNSVDLSADGKRLLTGSGNGLIYLWTTQTDELLASARLRRKNLDW